MKIWLQGFVSLLLSSLMMGCLLTFSATPTPVPATPTVTPPPSTEEASIEEWQTLAEGLELKMVVPEDNAFGQLLVLRIDPTLYAFRVHYRPGAPLSTSGWSAELPEAVAFINANFFDRQHNILGLLIADGVVYGTPYTDRGGMFAIQDGLPVIRSNVESPYQGEALEQAVQAFPLLVFDGAQTYTTLRGDRATRRTIVAQDADGNVLLIAAPLVGMRLAETAAYLLETDLEIMHALNLDGGGSTMMAVQDDEPFVISSFDRVPAVLAVYPR
jgi:exopolysaccharide biosynthesis protein